MKKINYYCIDCGRIIKGTGKTGLCGSCCHKGIRSIKWLKKVKCLYCGKEFLTPKYRPQKWCSKECYCLRNLKFELKGEYLDKRELILTLYLSDLYRLEEIEEILNISRKEISRQVNNINQRKRKGYIPISKKILLQKYIKEKKSALQVAKEMKKTKEQIFYWLKKYNIKIRSVKEHLKIHPRPRGRNNPNYKEKIKKTCVICRKKFEVYPCLIDTPTCSKKCGYKLHSLNMKKEGNSNWQGGINKEPYAFEWNEDLKESIHKRDKYTCQLCGITEEEHLVIYGRKNPVHHIDYDKKNCKEDNLITLCTQCNTRVNFNREYWKEYFKEKINKKGGDYHRY